MEDKLIEGRAGPGVEDALERVVALLEEGFRRECKGVKGELVLPTLLASALSRALGEDGVARLRFANLLVRVESNSNMAPELPRELGEWAREVFAGRLLGLRVRGDRAWLWEHARRPGWGRVGLLFEGSVEEAVRVAVREVCRDKIEIHLPRDIVALFGLPHKKCLRRNNPS